MNLLNNFVVIDSIVNMLSLSLLLSLLLSLSLSLLLSLSFLLFIYSVSPKLYGKIHTLTQKEKILFGSGTPLPPSPLLL